MSGLRVVQDILDDIHDIHFARLTSRTLSGTLVGKIVDAYERYDAKPSPPGTDQRRPHHRRTK